MTTVALLKALADARRLEALTGSFELSLRNRAQQLHRAIQLPAQRRSSALVRFATSYIEQTVTLIEFINCQAREQGVTDSVEPAIRTALSFFTPPPASVSRIGGDSGPRLRQLMEQAYLAQRLLEEVNDLFVLWQDTRLITFDTTSINLIIHQLIGEHYANQLDAIANRVALELTSAIQSLPGNESRAGKPARSNLHPLPLLRSDASIRLDFGTQCNRIA